MSRKPQAAAGAPEWMVTYGDCMSLLLCIFIALGSMSEIKKDRFDRAAASLQKAFGGLDGARRAISPDVRPMPALIDRLLELDDPTRKIARDGAAEAEKADEHAFAVTRTRDGLRMVLGGRTAFDRFSAVLKPEARELLAKTAERLSGYHTRILVRGHATAEPLPEDSMFDDARDLSYARAKAVARELEQNGVRRERLTPVAVGDAEPLLRRAYTEATHAVDRRVEIFVTEDVVDDDAGDGPADDLKGFSDGQR